MIPIHQRDLPSTVRQGDTREILDLASTTVKRFTGGLFDLFVFIVSHLFPFVRSSLEVSSSARRRELLGHSGPSSSLWSTWDCEGLPSIPLLYLWA
jgi:hypothetical protein